MKKAMTLIVTVLLLALLLSGCHSEGFLRTVYQSEDSGTVIIIDPYGILYLLTEDDVAITSFSYNPETKTMWIGDSAFDYETEEDETVLLLGGERFVSTRRTLSMTWRTMKASIQTYIGQRGFLGWLISPLYLSGGNSVGNNAIFAAAVVDVGVIALFIAIVVIFSKMSDRRR